GAEIPPASRKLVQGLKGILADRTEAEIYATLLDCAMDPDVAVERLISQDPFHEVRRKRSNKKEVKAPQETRSRPFYKPAYRGSKVGLDRGGRGYSGPGDSTASAKGPIKKETELLPPPNTSTSDAVKGSNPMETISEAGNLADAKSTSFQPPQVQHGWGGVPGRPSLAEIVKMGRPQAKSGARPVANNAAKPAVGGSVAANANLNTVLPSEGDRVIAEKLPNGTIQSPSVPKEDSVGILPPGQGSDVPEGIGAASANVSAPRSFTLEVKNDGAGDANEQTKETSASNATGLTSPGPLSPSDEGTVLNNDMIEKTDGYLSDEHSFEHNQNSNGDMSTTAYQLEDLTIHEENRPKPSDDNPAVIIPGHLQVSNADFAHLTFGSFVSGTLDASCSMMPANSDVEVAAVPDNQSGDQCDVRIHEFENKETVTPAANEYIASAPDSNAENPDITSAQQSDVGRADLLDVTNNTEYNLSSDYATSSAVQPEPTVQTYLQDNRQMQNISPLSNFMQGNMPNGLLPPAMPPFRELDPAFSLLLTNPPLATMVHGTPQSSVNNATVSSQPQENVNQGGLSNPQLTHSQGSTGIAPGPPLPHHLAALHPYAQGGLPLGYANMIGYPSLPQSYAYLPPAAYQQAYMNSGLFHQGAAAAPNSGVKYPMPQYKSNVPLGSLPQPASMLSNYVGGFGTANGMPQNFALNQSNPSATTAPGFDGAMPSQYKDGNPYMSLQQVRDSHKSGGTRFILGKLYDC
uniref:GBF-interacting protein 1 N-terminal domain-containing protein n=1 Tax=Aegilops tauschii subsp. strangulata TaxID=200361 RepID=A0A453A0L8_AEGTS